MNLHSVFGKRYAISIDPSWCAECPERRAEVRLEDVHWRYHEVRGKFGWVYPYSETELAVVLPTRAARRLVKLMGPELTLLQHADLEKCYKADTRHAEALVRFIKPKSLRQLPLAHKAALAARLAVNRHKRWTPPVKNSDPLMSQPVIMPGTEPGPLANPHVLLDVAPHNPEQQISNPYVEGRPL